MHSLASHEPANEIIRTIEILSWLASSWGVNRTFNDWQQHGTPFWPCLITFTEQFIKFLHTKRGKTWQNTPCSFANKNLQHCYAAFQRTTRDFRIFQPFPKSSFDFNNIFHIYISISAQSSVRLELWNLYSHGDRPQSQIGRLWRGPNAQSSSKTSLRLLGRITASEKDRPNISRPVM